VPVHNADIAAIFEEIAELLEIKQENPFRIRAYHNAARTVSELGRDLAEMIERGGELPKLPGVGADLAGKIREICETGTCALLERLHRELPTHRYGSAGHAGVPGGLPAQRRGVQGLNSVRRT